MYVNSYASPAEIHIITNFNSSVTCCLTGSALQIFRSAVIANMPYLCFMTVFIWLMSLLCDERLIELWNPCWSRHVSQIAHVWNTLSCFKNATLIKLCLSQKKKKSVQFETIGKETINLCIIHAKMVQIGPQANVFSDAKMWYPSNTNSHCKGRFSMSNFRKIYFRWYERLEQFWQISIFLFDDVC